MMKKIYANKVLKEVRDQLDGSRRASLQSSKDSNGDTQFYIVSSAADGKEIRIQIENNGASAKDTANSIVSKIRRRKADKLDQASADYFHI
ncbi:MAG: hypothetical protein ACI4HI_17040 [Lachnospiraceae bacterium]